MADTQIDKPHVVNIALGKLGLGASTSIDEELQPNGQIDMAWNSTLATIMPLHGWQQLRDTVPATLMDGTPANGWQYGFVLPAGRVGDPLAVLQNVQREEYLRDFMYEGGRLYANVKPLWVRVRMAVDPQYWDAAFVEGFATLLAGFLAVPLLQDVDLERQRKIDALGTEFENNPGHGGLLGKLMALEKAAQPQGRGFMRNDPLTRVRLGGR